MLYAVCEGFCLGAISAMFDAQTDGIVGAAILSTLCVFVVAFVLYVTRIIKPTQKLAFAVIAGMGGLVLLYTFVFVLSIFNWGWLYSDKFRTVGVGVTLVAIVLAALSLVLDFGTIEAGVQAGAPKELEWYLAFGLMVTLDLALHLDPQAAGAADPQQLRGASDRESSGTGDVRGSTLPVRWDRSGEKTNVRSARRGS